MPEVKQKIVLLRHTADPQELVAMSSKLCYSSADIEQLRDGVEGTDQSAFIRKLASFGHFSPMEHASFTFGIEGVSRSLLAQITRHRIASFSVKSQRYVAEEGFSYIIPQSIKDLGLEFTARFEKQMRTIQGWYDQWLQDLGNNGEQSNQDARFILPNGAETKLIVTMNARELLHFFSMRCCNRAQWEIQELAWTMLELAMKAAPVLFEQAGPACIDGTCSEGKMSCGNPQQAKERLDEIMTRVREDGKNIDG